MIFFGVVRASKVVDPGVQTKQQTKVQTNMGGNSKNVAQNISKEYHDTNANIQNANRSSGSVESLPDTIAMRVSVRVYLGNGKDVQVFV